MVFIPPMPLAVLGMNIYCRLLVCRFPYNTPKVVYDNSQDLISANYRFGTEGGSVGESDNYYDVGAAPAKNLVATRSGWIEGYYMTTSGGRMIGAWEGIKYGVARRWEESVPVPGWNGVKMAGSPGSDCFQISARRILKVYGDEDCLFLNIYSPVISGDKKNAGLPVVVHIHGGSFLFGAGRDYGPSYLLNEDVVMVTINYRLGILGFLSTGDSVLPGNLGLKDQRLAMQWVQGNIAAFGGNPGQVTLSGHSAGGASVHLHMMSPKSEGLFSRAFSQSGTAFNPFAVHPPWRARSQAETIAEWFGCPTANSEAMIRCLKTVELTSLVSSQIHLIKWFPYPPVTFIPTLDLEADSPFLEGMPIDLYRAGRVAKKPWIASVTEHEGLTAIMASELSFNWPATKWYWSRVAPVVLDIEYLHLKNESRIVDKVTKYYLGNKVSTAGTPFEYSNMVGDRLFHVGVVSALQAHSAIAPTYAYLFSFSSGNYSFGDWNLHRPTEWGAGHGEDENYFFNSTLIFPPLERNDPEYKISKIMLNFLTNFVMNGTPSYTPTSSEWGKKPLFWEPVTNPRKIGFLRIDKEIQMVTPSLERVKFWQDLNLPDAQLFTKL